MSVGCYIDTLMKVDPVVHANCENCLAGIFKRKVRQLAGRAIITGKRKWGQCNLPFPALFRSEIKRITLLNLLLTLVCSEKPSPGPQQSLLPMLQIDWKPVGPTCP